MTTNMAKATPVEAMKKVILAAIMAKDILVEATADINNMETKNDLEISHFFEK